MLFLVLLGGLATVAEPARAAHVHVRPSAHVYWGPGWAWYDPWWYYGPRWGGWWGYPVTYPNAAYGSYGALDTNLSPERAEVWVDGKKVGLADDFDGFPNFLWLEKGTYDVAFYLPGHVTLARQYTIYPGMVVDVEDRLEPGEATHPLEIGPKTHERRDARLRDDEDRRAAEKRLVRDAQNGDLLAFERLYRENERKVFALCLRMSSDAALAEELTQEAFVRAWRKLDGFRGDSAFSSWLYPIAVA